MIVDVFFAGLPKCGSSSAYDFFKGMPCVDVGLVKEPATFLTDDCVNQCASYYSQNDDLIKMDFTVEYAVDIDSLHRIFRHNPKAKIVLLLRNPYVREYSHFSHRSHRGGSLDGLIARYGCYAKVYKQILTVFPGDQICVVPVETLSDLTELKRLCDFCGVKNFDEKTNLFGVSNQGGVPKSKYLNRVINSVVASGVSGVIPPNLRSVLTRVKSYLIKINTREELYKYENYNFSMDYTSELRELEEILGTTLPVEYYSVPTK